MAVPDFQSLMLPVLRELGDREEHPTSSLRAKLAATLQLTAEDLAQTLESGTALFTNRVAWSISYLKRAGLIESTGRGVYQITAEGIRLLQSDIPRITVKLLDDVMVDALPATPAIPAVAARQLTPEEQIEEAHAVLLQTVAAELLEAVQALPPAGFERLVIKVLEAMGYGGSLDAPGAWLGRPGDGGIDGTIRQDKLGLDMIYIQAKRWRDPVGSPEVMRFCGGLTAHHAHKGVLITTSSFTKDARDYAGRIPQRIILIDGPQLANLMIEHGVGVTTKAAYLLKRLDLDFFDNL